jgi:hypothetical protein
MKKRIIAAVGLFALTAWFFQGTMPDTVYKILPGYFPDEDKLWAEMPFEESNVSPLKTPFEAIQARIDRQTETLTEYGVESDTQILFGDTHVHTTNSTDAFLFSLPLLHGSQGAFPPSYACDYSRFVSQIDFYFLTDHAESYTPERWKDAIESIRQCNEIAQGVGLQDTFAFMGWEWSQSGLTAKKHYGHHNVLFKDYGEGDIPSRPIAAVAEVVTIPKRDDTGKNPKIIEYIDPRHGDYYAEFNNLIDQMADTPVCEKGIPSPELPADCYEEVNTTGELFAKLKEWDIDTMVIPHGMTWGLYTPPGASWETHLNPVDIDPSMTPLLELYSGHGNAEKYSKSKFRIKNENGTYTCPAPTKDYLPTCWQAGEIIKDRCPADNLSEEVCNERVAEARYIAANTDTNYAFLTVELGTPQEMLDAGQERDMFNPALNYRPMKSAQYGLALRNFDGDKPLGFEWGFIGSSDTHTARAGNGFKQIGRLHVTDANGHRDPYFKALIRPQIGEKVAKARDPESIDAVKYRKIMAETERVSSFMYLGGLAAVHTATRDRDGIWNAMKAKQVYSTSGHRILLWMDMIKEGKKIASMGDKVLGKETPSFKVTAIGSAKQASGCPDYVTQGLNPAQLRKMSFGECYNPTKERYNIERIEITRIQPQSFAGEPVEDLIEDKWKIFQCSANSVKCEFTFEDPEFVTSSRDTVYYARVIEEKIPMINGNNLRSKFDDQGKVISTDICFGSSETAASDECLAELGHRAWSSPIFVYYQ